MTSVPLDAASAPAGVPSSETNGKLLRVALLTVLTALGGGGGVVAWNQAQHDPGANPSPVAPSPEEELRELREETKGLREKRLKRIEAEIEGLTAWRNETTAALAEIKQLLSD